MSYHYIPIISSSGEVNIFTAPSRKVPLKVHCHALEVMRSVPRYALIMCVSHLDPDNEEHADFTVGNIYANGQVIDSVKWREISTLVGGYRDLDMLPDDWKEQDNA